MGRIRNKIITALLKKDKLVAVPEKWHRDYVRMAGDEVKRNEAIATIITEYNKLLSDYFHLCSVNLLHDTLDGEKIKYKTTMTKDELANLAYEEFKMTIEKN